MKDINILNIPAFKRKKSIESQKNKIRPIKKTRKRLNPEEISALSDIPFTTELQPTSFEESIIKQSKNTSSEVRQMRTCGKVDGFFNKIGVAAISVTNPIRPKDTLIFETNEGLFEETIDSIQKNGKQIKLARSGDEIGIKVSLEPKIGGQVYKVIE